MKQMRQNYDFLRLLDEIMRVYISFFKKMGRLFAQLGLKNYICNIT
jgi:hypothetical protein